MDISKGARKFGAKLPERAVDVKKISPDAENHCAS
jgi:hypothetical protein